ncbi:unnamed protein product [Polarella glacialis]|uniref:Sulfatase-modifying factor enzyme-like domain-containing protein n=1 Tax=Polarella glacialis TaxID=89957 RepID=A0A813DCQ0_POLGL|nr:unnamed protein product [Polarella glacialis]
MISRLFLSFLVFAAVPCPTWSSSAESGDEGVCSEQDGSCSTAGGDPASSGSSCGCGALKRADFVKDGVKLSEDKAGSHELRSSTGETDEEAGIIYLDGGSFIMGLIPKDEKDPTVVFSDGEGPPHKETVGPFGLGVFEVSNRRFAIFVEQTGYVTESETYGWSFGVEAFISPEVNATITQQVDAAPWWLPVERADWRHPNGPDTRIHDLMDHPVTQVSLKDAEAFCSWSRQGGRLPTEVEWEFAARGGKKSRRYPWGNTILTGAHKNTHRMNIWQSELDVHLLKDGRVRNLYGHKQALQLVKEYYSSLNTAEDGYNATAPVDAFGPQNPYGFHNMVGNVWEWTSTNWAGASDPNTMVKKGGSFLCNPATCNRFRCSARMMFTGDSAASNVGFRCAYTGKGSQSGR